MEDRRVLTNLSLSRGVPWFAVCVVVWAGVAPLGGGAATFEDRTALICPGVGGGPSAWGDYNNDGYVDLNDGGLRLNQRGTNFTVGTGFGPGIWGDYNNDGHIDIFTVTPVPRVGRSLLPAAGFAQVSMPPIAQAGCAAFAWVDLDGDGRLDLYLTDDEYVSSGGNPEPDCMLKANPNGTFSNVWVEPLVQGISFPGKGVTACDFDEDGDQDVYVSNYRLQPNYLWRNDRNWHFTDVAQPYGVAGGANDGALWSAAHTEGSAWGDFDNDGHFDLFVGNFSHAGQEPALLYRNLGPTGSWHFALMWAMSGADWQESYATPALGDYDNDGYLDLFFTTTYDGDHARLYHNDGNWHFTDVTAAAGLAGLPPTRQAAWADFNNDGQLDLVTGGKLFVNTGNANHWLKVRLKGDGVSVNRAAIGAQARIRWNGQIQSRQVEGGTGMNGNQNDLTLHFGLGSHGEPVDLEVFWPNGVTQKVTGVAVDRLVEVGAGGPQVANGVGATGVTYGAAWLTGNVISTGAAPTDVCVYWGTTTNWTGQQCLSGVGTGQFAVSISGLSPNTAYAYRCYATNAYGDDWADAVAWFTTAGVLPFRETFEDRAVGPLDLQYGWQSDPTNAAIVQTAETFAGSSKACSIRAGVLRHLFGAAGAPSIVWTDAYLKPNFNADASPAVVPDSVAALCVEADTGYVVVYDGATRTVLTNQPSVSPSEWVRFTLRCDYAARQWDLWMNGSNVARNLRFHNPALSRFAELGLADGTDSSRAAALDNVSVSLSRPPDIPFIDDDHDGMDDDWEILHFGSITNSAGGPAEDRDGDGFIDLFEFLAGTDPTNPTSRLAIANAWTEAGLDAAIRWYSASNKFYALLNSTNLVSNSWLPIVSNIPGTPPMNTATVTVHTTPAFYRIKLQE